METIRLSALGRDVEVSDIYDYCSDTIIKGKGISSIEIYCSIYQTDIAYNKLLFSYSLGDGVAARKYLKEYGELKPVTIHLLLSSVPDTFRCSFVGIDAHFEEGIKQGTLDISKLWLADYIESRPTEGKDNGARVTLHIRVIQRSETLEQQFIDQKMSNLKPNCGIRATHLVEQVVYGAEFICCLRRNIDLKVETKIEAEEKIYWPAKNYFVQATTNCTEMEPPPELDNVSCVLYSSLAVGQVLNFTVLRNSVDWLRKTILFTKDEDWRPVEISLLEIPVHLENLLQSEKIMKNENEMELNWNWIRAESRILTKHPAIHRIPPFKKTLDQFVNLLEPLRSKFEQFRAAEFISFELILKRQEHVQHLLSCAMDWLARLRREINSLNLILNGSQLDIPEFPEGESQPPTPSPSRVNAFILHADYKQDPLMEDIQKLLGHPSPDVKRPFFPIVAAGKKRLEEVGEALRSFSEETRLCSDDCSYQIKLVPASSSMTEGSVESIYLPAMLSSPPQNVPILIPLIDLMPSQDEGTTDDEQLLEGYLSDSPPQLERSDESSNKDEAC